MSDYEKPGFQDSQLHTPFPPVISGEPAPSRSFFERILNPQALQRMMAVGGSILVLGLIGWLWSMGVFDHPAVVATALGTVTLATVGIGCCLVRYSRYQLAGFGITLLGILAMPLNLWFYDAQGLMTLSEGGHLWIPATICCGIYALVARILKKPIFVYTLVGGVVMTGMLLLADQSVGRFAELMAPVTFLVSIGWICVFAERFFESGKGAFSREEFGKAFYRAGMVVLSAGLSLLFFAQSMYTLEWYSGFDTVRLLSGHAASSQIWALAVLTISSVGFAVLAGYRSERIRMATVAIGLGVWAMACGFDYLNIQIQVPHVAVALGILVIARSALSIAQRGTNEVNDKSVNNGLNFLLVFTLASLASTQFIALFFEDRETLLFAPASLIVLVQMVVSACACWILTLTRETGSSEITEPAHSIYRALSGSLMAIAAVSGWLLFDSVSLTSIAVVGLVFPIGVALLQRTWLNPVQNNMIPSAASASLATLFVAMVLINIAPFGAVASASTWAWFLGIAGLVCLYGSRQNITDRVLGHLAIAGAFWSLATLFQVAPEFALPVAISLAGSVLVVFGFLTRVSQQDDSAEVQRGSFAVIAHTYIAAGSLMGILLCLSRLIGDELLWSHAGLLAAQLGSIGLASLLSRDKKWQSAFLPLAIANVATLAFVVNAGLDISVLHRVELMILAAGAILIGSGHLGWYREGEQEDTLATNSLWLGSLFLSVPLAIGIVAHRLFLFDIGSPWEVFHTWSALLVSVSFLCAGVTCHIRATTFSGAGLFVVFAAALIGWPEQLMNVSVAMMVGGGLFFVTAVLLSIYRDRLVQLPEKIREGRGVFSVMRWR